VTEHTAPIRTSSGLVRPVVAGAFLAVAAVGIAAAVRDRLGETLTAIATPRVIPFFLAALAVCMAGLVLSLTAWRTVLTGLGSRLSRAASARIFCVGMLSKYIPGPVWGPLAHVQMGRAAGVPAARVLAAYVVSAAVAVITGFAVGLGVAGQALAGRVVWLLPAAAAAAVFVSRPDLVTRVMAVPFRLARRPMVDAVPSRGSMRRAVVAELASWLVSGLHVWILATALGARFQAGLICISGFALATVAGMVAMFLPDGAGVREVALAAVLGSVLPWPAAVVVAVASRICLMVSEVTAAAAAMVLVRPDGLVRFAGRRRGTLRNEGGDDGGHDDKSPSRA